jgi:hypothetical protein
MINRDKIGFYNIDLKLGNMRKSQEFTLYPSQEGQNVYLQSDKRCLVVNTESGTGKLLKSNKDYPTFAMLSGSENSIIVNLDPSTCKELADHYLTHQAGTNEVKIQGTTILTY